MSNPSDFNCNKCKRHHHCDVDGEWPDSQGASIINICSIEGVIESKVCLLPLITDRSRLFLNLHKHYKNNYLPFSGGLMDQPQLFLEAMEILEP